MTNLILMSQASGCTDELAAIFHTAGYDVVEVRDVASCCRQLQAELLPPSMLPGALGEAAAASRAGAVTIFNANAIALNLDTSARKAHLRQFLVNLARQLTPGWRLSMRHRRLEAPAGAIIELTTLEFIFIKIFAMVDVGEAVSRKSIVLAFGEDYLSYDQNRIDTLVRRLRQKIEACAGVQLPLNTERVRGYSFGDLLIIDP